MKKILILLAACTTARLLAQTTVNQTDSGDYGTIRGDREFSIGGSGSTNKDFDDSVGGINFAFGYYLSPAVEALVRQTVNYSNPNNGDNSWGGWTRLAIDQHFGDGRFRPFLGVNGGRVYGDAVRDSWTAGLETGGKLYVRPRTFVQLTVEYGWFFQHSRDVEDRFDDGQWNWSLGLGYNF